MDRLGEFARIVEIGVARLPPQHVGMRREGQPARDAMLEPGAVLQAEEPLGGALAGQERAGRARRCPTVINLRALGVGPRNDQRRHPAHVGGEPRGVEVADVRLGRNEHLAAEMAALLLGRQLVLEMDRGDPRLDIGLHDFEAVQRPAEPGFGIGDDRNEPVALRAAFADLDLVGALERLVDALGELRPGIGGIERLVGIHCAGGVGVGSDLPARQIDRLKPGADHLHCLVAGHRAKRAHRLVAVHQLPQFLRPAPRQRMLDRDRPAQLTTSSAE